MKTGIKDYSKEVVGEVEDVGVSYPADSIKTLLNDFSDVFEKKFTRLSVLRNGKAFAYAEDGSRLKIRLV